MDKLVQYLGLGWVGSLVGILGIVLSIWVYFRSVRKAVPVVAFESIRLVGGTGSALPDAVTVLYQDRAVPRLTRSNVRLWNNGNLTLDGVSVAVVDPIRLEIEPDAEFLSVSIAKASRAVTQIRADILPTEPNKVVIQFDFLDPSDGALIECLHTGHTLSPQIKGVIKGIPNGVTKKDVSGFRNPPKKKFPRFLMVIVSVMTLIGGPVIAVSPFFDQSLFQIKIDSGLLKDPMNPYIAMLMGASYFLAGLIMVRGFLSPYPKSLRSGTDEGGRKKLSAIEDFLDAKENT